MSATISIRGGAAAPPAAPRAGQLPVRWRREIWTILGVLLAVKAAVLAVDHVPRVFLGDSVTYLHGALDGVIPRDRSFVYSIIIALTAVPAHSLTALVLAQSLAGALSATLVYAIARGGLDLSALSSGVVAILVALEPAQLFYERMVMAEAFGGLAWFAFIGCAVAYFRSGDWRWLPGAAACGLAAAALRMNGLAVLLAVGGLLPAWRWLLYAPARDRDWRRLGAHLMLAIACTSALHVGYRHLVGRLTNAPPGYIGIAGVFELGMVVPLVEPADFAGTGCPADILDRVGVPLRDPTMRESHIWREDGLWPVMRRTCRDAEQAAALVADRALAERPWGLLPMAAAIIGQYFDPAAERWRMDSDLGRQDLGPDFLALLKSNFDLDAKPIPRQVTLTSAYFEAARWWLTLAFLALPFLAATALRRARDESPGAAALAVIALVLSVSALLFQHIISYRYPHPYPPLILLLVTWLAAVGLRPRGAAAESGEMLTVVDPRGSR
jgi:hypothetical protein